MLFRRQRVSTVLTYGHNSFNFKLRSSTDVISILLINSIRTANRFQGLQIVGRATLHYSTFVCETEQLEIVISCTPLGRTDVNCMQCKFSYDG